MESVVGEVFPEWFYDGLALQACLVDNDDSSTSDIDAKPNQPHLSVTDLCLAVVCLHLAQLESLSLRLRLRELLLVDITMDVCADFCC